MTRDIENAKTAKKLMPRLEKPQQLWRYKIIYIVGDIFGGGRCLRRTKLEYQNLIFNWFEFPGRSLKRLHWKLLKFEDIQ